MKKNIALFNQLRFFLSIAISKLFNKSWYLEKNKDIAKAGVNPYLHYLNHGGFEGRNPSPEFDSSWYLDTYKDVKEAGINPLIHYLHYGKKEGRAGQPPQNVPVDCSYKCPVCQEKVDAFMPLPSFYLEKNKVYDYSYTVDSVELINVEQYSCPHCGASDRDRLYALYLEKRIPQHYTKDKTLLLDIAPAPSLSQFINKHESIVHKTADQLIEDVDITNMPEVASDSYDVLICSHVLEHVPDNKKALAELFRVLKPGGWGIIMVPIVHTIEEIDEDPSLTDPTERRKRFGQDDHVRLYSKIGFTERVEAAGFNLKKLGVEHFGESDFKKYGITNNSVLYVVEKPHILPVLTILFVTYNHRNSIEKAMESVLEQSTSYPYEIWLCDDCSTDGTLEICESYAKKHPDRIKLFAQPTNTYSDLSKTFQVDAAVRNVKTKYFCILEGDDAWCDNTKIQIALDVLEENQKYVTFAHDVIYDDIVDGTKKSLVHGIHKAEIHNPMIFENARFLHPSARIYRNIIDFSENTERHHYWDIFLFYIYLDKGPLYYHDKIMSIHYLTGKGLWTSLEEAEKRRNEAMGYRKLNKYFNFKYDDFFTRKINELESA